MPFTSMARTSIQPLPERVTKFVFAEKSFPPFAAMAKGTCAGNCVSAKVRRLAM